jgi:hypothetical protein
MTVKSRFILIAALSIFTLSGVAQLQQNIDLAINHNKLLREKQGDGVYKLIGTYKVIGTSYLFGEKNKGNLFTPETKAYNIALSYNTYNQEVEFYSSSNPDKPLIKSPGEVDSFSFSANPELELPNTIRKHG